MSRSYPGVGCSTVRSGLFFPAVFSHSYSLPAPCLALQHHPVCACTYCRVPHALQGRLQAFGIQKSTSHSWANHSYLRCQINTWYWKGSRYACGNARPSPRTHWPSSTRLEKLQGHHNILDLSSQKKTNIQVLPRRMPNHCLKKLLPALYSG